MVNFCNVSVCVYWLLVLTHDYDVMVLVFLPNTFLNSVSSSFVFSWIYFQVCLFSFLAFVLLTITFSPNFFCSIETAVAADDQQGLIPRSPAKRKRIQTIVIWILVNLLSQLVHTLKTEVRCLIKCSTASKEALWKVPFQKNWRYQHFYCVYGFYMGEANFW